MKFIDENMKCRRHRTEMCPGCMANEIIDQSTKIADLDAVLRKIRVVTVGDSKFVCVMFGEKGFWSVEVKIGGDLFDRWQNERDEALGEATQEAAA